MMGMHRSTNRMKAYRMPIVISLIIGTRMAKASQAAAIISNAMAALSMNVILQIYTN